MGGFSLHRHPVGYREETNQVSRRILSGIPSLDEVLQGIRLGDNVVWQVDELDDYSAFAQPFMAQAIRDGRKCVYMRFASHPPILAPHPQIDVIELDPAIGFDPFASSVHRIIEKRGHEAFYVFDNLSHLVAEWATDELLANFFQITCPYLYELDTVAYFALKLGKHEDGTVARIRDTTQLLINLHHAGDQLIFHAVKVWGRYSSRMFLPNEVTEHELVPVIHSGDAAEITSVAHKNPLRTGAESIAPWDSVYRRLLQYSDQPEEVIVSQPETLSLKQELARMLLGNHPDFVRLSDEYFTLEDLFAIRNRIVGSGRIGGKALGMLLARKILRKQWGEDVYRASTQDHDSFFIGSDVFFTFLVNNDLFRLRLQLSRAEQTSQAEFEDIEERFLEGTFPREVMNQFQNMLEYFGQAPIIVRSSSLLEDSFGNAFAGKYRSEFCTNQGSPEQRMEAFLKAVKQVYASALDPNALSYRRKRGLAESDEQMGLLVQRVSGMPFRRTFFPSLAGVAFSKNLYAWTDRIDRSKGMIRLVFGLGTRAVDRTNFDYPRMVSVSQPELRPETGFEVVKYSQKEMDLLDLDENALVTRPVEEALGRGEYPNEHLLISTIRNGFLSDPSSSYFDSDIDGIVLTFSNLIRQTNLIPLIGRMLETLEKAYGIPIDTEFTAFIGSDNRVRFNLLQCRPMILPGMEGGEVEVSEDIPRDKVLFRANRIMSGGRIADVRFVVFIDPSAYASIESDERRRSIGRVVGKINAHPTIQTGKCIMVGPGRWGSSNISMGVNVSYGDINNTSVLVEVGKEEAGHAPEVSYGTHFFQDLVEAKIIYLPVFPPDPAAEFNAGFFEKSRNSLAAFCPEVKDFEDVVKLIDIPEVTRGLRVQVLADPRHQKAVCFLASQ